MEMRRIDFEVGGAKNDWDSAEGRSTFLALDKDPVYEKKESKVQKAQLSPETQRKRRSRPQRLKPPYHVLSIDENHTKFHIRVRLYKSQVGESEK